MLIEFKRSALMDQVLTILRDKQTKAKEFRQNLRQLGIYLAYESAKFLSTTDTEIITPVSSTSSRTISDDIVVLALLRAAMPMAEAVLEQYTNASYGVISASRGKMVTVGGTAFEINGGYSNIPDLKDKVVIVVDPMLASGSTLKFLLNKLQHESPKKIQLLVAIASKFGVSVIEEKYPDVEIFTAVVDDVLDEKGYISPGLGDAGDRVCNTSH